MADFQYAGLEHFTLEQQRVLRALIDSHNRVAQQANTSPVGETPAPIKHAAANVQGGGGVIAVNITDNSPQYRGLHHFVDVSSDQSFSKFETISDGPSLSMRRQFAPGTYYTRSYSQYGTSAPSEMLYHGQVSTAGSQPPPVQGDNKVGFGINPYNTAEPPKR